MPQLKRVQQQNMRESVEKQIFQLRQDICQRLVQEWIYVEIPASADAQTARPVGQEQYSQAVNRVKSQYLKFWGLTQHLANKLAVAKQADPKIRGTYSDLIDALKIKLLNSFEDINFRADNSVEI